MAANLSLPGPTILSGRMLLPTTIDSSGKVSTATFPAPSPKTTTSLPLPPSSGTPPPPPAPSTATAAALPLPPTTTAAAAATAPPLPPTTTTAATTDHLLANQLFASKNYHKAVAHYKTALELATIEHNLPLQGTLQSNLAATFQRLHRYQEATVAARAAVNIAPTPKAYFRLMKGLEGQRLLPEAIAVGMHAVTVINEADSTRQTTATATAQSRSTIVALLEKLHAQTVFRPRTASDSIQHKTSATLTSTTPTLPSTATTTRSEELSRRILKLGVYATVNEDGKENNNVGATAKEQRVNVINRHSMESGAKIAHPDAFVPFNAIELSKVLHMYTLKLMHHQGAQAALYVAVEENVEQGQVVYTDTGPLVVHDQLLQFDSTGIDRAACTLFEKLWSISNMVSFSTFVRRLFNFVPSSPTVDPKNKTTNPFAKCNRAVFREFAQEMACRGMGTDKMTCVKHYATAAAVTDSKTTYNNPLSVLLVCLHLIRSSLQPFEEGDGKYGVTLSVGCPVVGAQTGTEATVGFKTVVQEDDSNHVQYIATRDLQKGEILSAVFVGNL